MFMEVFEYMGIAGFGDIMPKAGVRSHRWRKVDASCVCWMIPSGQSCASPNACSVVSQVILLTQLLFKAKA